ncbi:hypothetical protein [Aequorivita antarctica]|uniref:Uncharacterized protein n=1 Tax=Aequorivita antarctica TaxID=153266 RepID=A0A5C6Z1V0_9FLAO|nr:hypothetical protein [Aequorivita antarctica]TXD73902.1 hypothetical protein ESU54_05380 [Aequorivita antarctica]SRX73379.1 hypothetical protein AEQU3_00815 [Aequorivita antarctica]
MKIKLLLIIAIISLSACDSQIELNKYNFDSVKDYALKAIKEKDSISFMNLFDLTSPEFKSSNYGEGVSQIKNVISTNFKQAYKTLDNSQLEFLKYDFSDALNGGQIIDNGSFIIFVKANGNIYRLRFPTYNDKNKDANSLMAFYFENISNECSDFKSKPYNPTMLRKKELMWNNYDRDRFDFVALRLYNLTPYKIENIKYRITISRKSDNAMIYMKTLDSEISINEGDVGEMIIEGLKGTYLGEKIREENFDWSVDILEVMPKPNQNPCEKIESLIKA